MRPEDQAGIEAQRRGLATVALLVALTVLAILAPKLVS